jgi:hypothetical protein
LSGTRDRVLTSTTLPKGRKGTVISPDDPGYDEARTVYYGGILRPPRLPEIKARHDPDNLFRLNHNVPPAPPR